MTVDLTQQMIDDFCKYIKPEYVDLFISSVREDEKRYGRSVTRIEDIPYPSGKPGIMEKHYYFDNEDEPSRVLDSLQVGVDSL